MIERRRIWTDDLLAGYVRDELGFPGARQGAMVEKERVNIATGEVGRGVLVPADQPEFPALRTKGTA